jgi:hypothetical protein
MYAISKENLNEQMNEIEDLKIKLQEQYKENLKIEMTKNEMENKANNLLQKLGKSELKIADMTKMLEKNNIKSN